MEMQLLTYDAERKMTELEKYKYYLELRAYALKRKLTNVTAGAVRVAPKLKKPVNVITKGLTRILAGGPVEMVSDGQENIPDCPVIFAHTHQGLLDNIAWIAATPRHCIVLHSAVVNKVLGMAQYCVGLIFVKKAKGEKKNRENATWDMIKLLLSGHSIAFFPEGAWNLSPNKLHLQMSWGVVNIAQKAGVPIVPVVNEYVYEPNPKKERITKIHTRFGKPIYVNGQDDLQEKLQEYKDNISTMRWEMIEENGLFKRRELSPTYYRDYVKANIKNLRAGGIDVNVERELLFGSQKDFYLFHHINDVPCDDNGCLQETQEQKRLRQINKEHNI